MDFNQCQTLCRHRECQLIVVQRVHFGLAYL